ncbi:hypothetical protein H5089_12440 [Pseudoalteromonas sp. SR45-1]|uniref:hypothetical protein n=1 Tax=Pseudoalteromonas TaxID=53246 RepID=UPI0016001CF8|nr:hypothetical protein [Pseudoalteromonas sp. SR45-1]MBB1326297.1 hypothetical protein [Pseudoalteromonas sp. SR45-1]|tara:strand:- start:223 stop:726 length:504 start_codon:yes stop_codon:yes gene_type:complete
MKILLIITALVFSVSAWSESWKIGKTLEVDPSGIDVTFQVFPDYDPVEKLVHGWKGEELRYLILVDQQPGGKKSKKYWEGMLKELKKGADDRKLTVLSEGVYSGASNNEISFKVLSWISEGDITTQMYNLVVGKRISYWVIASPFSEDTDYMVAGAKTLLSSSLLKE